MDRSLIHRRDSSQLGRWWWSVDRLTLLAILALMGVGVVISFASSPPVAMRLNLETFFFVKRHIIMTFPAIIMMLFFSVLSPLQIRRFCLLSLFAGIFLLIFTILYGIEIKGARRWLNINGFSLQPSEFIKPFFAVVSAWFFSQKAKNVDFPGIMVSFIIMLTLVTLLMLQPDLGMTIVLVSTWCVQLFLFGIPFIWIGIFIGTAIISFIGAYCFFPHVTKRVDQFLDPSAGDAKHELYQITQSLEAFMNGGLFGKGPGEGIVKKHVPDAHADFAFSVAGEEFGFIICSIIVLMFLFIIVKSLLRTLNSSSLFILLATSGLISQFALQTFVNMSSTLHLIPTKGMTMPFISYGGSSQIALGISVGIILAFTRKRYQYVEY